MSEAEAFLKSYQLRAQSLDESFVRSALIIRPSFLKNKPFLIDVPEEIFVVLNKEHSEFIGKKVIFPRICAAICAFFAVAYFVFFLQTPSWDVTYFSGWPKIDYLIVATISGGLLIACFKWISSVSLKANLEFQPKYEEIASEWHRLNKGQFMSQPNGNIFDVPPQQ